MSNNVNWVSLRRLEAASASPRVNPEEPGSSWGAATALSPSACSQLATRQKRRDREGPGWNPAKFNRQIALIKSPLTCRKQTLATSSNRQNLTTQSQSGYCALSFLRACSLSCAPLT